MNIKKYKSLLSKLFLRGNMKKRIIAFLLCAAFVYSASALTKVKLANGIRLEFEGCEDGSIRFEAKGKKAREPMNVFELKRKPSKEKFVASLKNVYDWRDYRVEIIDEGYNLLFKGEKLYTSTFKDDGKLLKELRNWETADEFYGFGEASRFTSLRNQSLTIFNESRYGDHAYVFIPFYVTNKNTAVFYNANGKDKIYFQDGDDAQLYRSEYYRIENFVRQDASMKESIQKFYAETETACIMPKWAYGYIQSKYGYKSTKEVIELVDNFKKHDIPLSAVVLDLYWFEKMGDIFWTSKDFADYKEMDEHMEKNGVKLITITEPFFTTASKNFEELKNSELLCKNDKGSIALWHDWWCIGSRDAGLFNPLGKKASSFMGEKYAAMLDSGIEGFWTDLGEPEKAPAYIKYGKYSEQDFHNYYNYYWSKALFEGVHEIYPDRRLFIMSRSAGTGSGKFNVSVWSGDVSVSWPALGCQIAYGLNAGISGLPYWGSDVGGFVGDQLSPDELYIRWQQFGAWTPIYRAHGTGPREPYAYSKKVEDIVADSIRTRAQLLPYIYSTARQTMNGIPMMRPMFYEDEKMPQQFMNSQFMFGDAFLVAPVVRDMVAESQRTLYLPDGNWFNFHSKEKIAGGKSITVKSVIENIPVYIKEGAIVPMEKNGKQTLFVAVDKFSNIKNTFVLYNDDGETEQYKKGVYGELVLELSGRTLKATVLGDKKFLSEKYIVETVSGNVIEVSIEELISGIEI